MKLLQAKLSKYQEPQKAKAAGIYPYFRAISSEQDTEVIINGKKVLMFGSNSYMGLTNHPKVKEAAIEAGCQRIVALYHKALHKYYKNYPQISIVTTSFIDLLYQFESKDIF